MKGLRGGGMRKSGRRDRSAPRPPPFYTATPRALAAAARLPKAPPPAPVMSGEAGVKSSGEGSNALGDGPWGCEAQV